jgi:hypothetical protein
MYNVIQILFIEIFMKQLYVLVLTMFLASCTIGTEENVEAINTTTSEEEAVVENIDDVSEDAEIEEIPTETVVPKKKEGRQSTGSS